MSDDPFLRAIIAAPDDDLPRLVYADWLEDRTGTVTCRPCRGTGKGALMSRKGILYSPACKTCRGTGTVPDGHRERAEFIRVQCELARLPPCEYDAPGVFAINCRCHTCGVRRRERELLSGNAWIQWLDLRGLSRALGGADYGPTLCRIPDPPNGERRIEWQFRRGFIASLTLTAADLLAHAAAVFGTAPVTSVILSDKRPLRPASNGTNFVWMRGEVVLPSMLPQTIFNWLGEGPRRDFALYDGTMAYPTEAAAQTDLSAACVRFGRSAAGLPAWEPATDGSGAYVEGGRAMTSGGPTLRPGGA